MRYLPVDPELVKKITLDTPVELLPVSARIYNCLRNEGLKTVREIAAQTDSFFYRIPNLGRVSIAQLGQLLADAGITTQIVQPRDGPYPVPFFYQQKIDRNRLIWQARQAGETIKNLAARFSLSRTSIDIILAKGEREARGLARLRAEVMKS